MTDPHAETRKPADLKRNARLIDRLYREQRGRLRAVARRHGAGPDQVDDIVQSALAAVISAYRGPASLDDLFSYTAVAVRTAVWREHRRYERKESHQIAMPSQERNDMLGSSEEIALVDPDAADPLDLISRREDVEQARRRLAELPVIEREILALGAGGYGNPEIAAIVGLSERAVRKRVTRARRRLYEQAE
jgi:RNA polymerase sigma factor (sigma-70 family)